MAGHSKWANIQHRKNRQDAKRGSLWTKIIREVTVAARDSGPDPSMNPRLRLALDKARLGNVPKDKLTNAIARGAGKLEGASYEEIRYEGYGPGGVAMIVEALTDNRNRTAGAVRSYFSKNGGALGETGSVAFMFDRVGEIHYKAEAGTADAVLEAAIDAGADDVASDDEGHFITTSFADIGDVARRLEEKLGEAETVKAVWRPQTRTSLDEEKAASLMKLVDTLDEDDDVQAVYSNFEVSDEVMEKLTA